MLLKDEMIHIFGVDTPVHEARSPTDTKYENLNVSEKMRRPYYVKQVFYMLYIFMVSTALTLCIKYGFNSLGQKYSQGA